MVFSELSLPEPNHKRLCCNNILDLAGLNRQIQEVLALHSNNHGLLQNQLKDVYRALDIYGIPKSVAWAINPPAIEPVNIAIPPTICPFAKIDSSVPLNPVNANAPTSQASVAPEKKRKSKS